jgi:uncharacterized membrane protein AbrB (regulator of aidB expression)
MSDPSTEAVEGVVKTVSKAIDTISNPVLVFLIVIVVIVLGAMLYIWVHQRTESLEAYTHLVDQCLPGREKT